MASDQKCKCKFICLTALCKDVLESGFHLQVGIFVCVSLDGLETKSKLHGDMLV